MTGDDEILPRLRVMQLIVVAMMAGVAIFLAFVHYHVANGQAVAIRARPPWLSWLALGLLAVQLPLSLVLPAIQTRNNVRRIANGAWPLAAGDRPEALATDTSKLLAVRLSTLLAAMAPLEGTAFFGCVAYLIEGQACALAVVAVVLAAMLARFPTEARVRGWLERQAERLTELRQIGP